jgi:hypothetical protein
MSTNATILNTIPANRNFLSSIPYQFYIKRCPNVNFFIQKVNLPGVSSQSVIQPTPFSDVPRPGVKLTWNPLMISFKVDEKLENYQEIWNWITALNEAESFEPYAELKAEPEFTGLNITSEIIVVMEDNERQPTYNVYFHDSFPVMLADLNFDGTQSDVEYITASVVFKYSTYSIEQNV